jgi:hypothetical protein
VIAIGFPERKSRVAARPTQKPATPNSVNTLGDYNAIAGAFGNMLGDQALGWQIQRRAGRAASVDAFACMPAFMN